VVDVFENLLLTVLNVSDLVCIILCSRNVCECECECVCMCIM
jgi:hypothetical protein